jgi:hypothetical protein
MYLAEMDKLYLAILGIVNLGMELTMANHYQ